MAGLKYQVIVKEVLAVVSQYTTLMTLRQIYYRLVAKLLFDNVQSNYKGLSSMLVKARLNGDMPFGVMEDRTRATSGGDRELQTPEEAFDGALDWLKERADYYHLPRWLNQDYYVEVWLEKQALSALFEVVCDRKRVLLAPCKGYPSLTFIKDASDRLQGQYDEGKKLVILYFGDFDPSGEDIRRYIGERLKNLGVVDLNIVKMALTPEQIEEHNLPPVPAKKSDSRAAAFIAKHGDISVELDALPPDVLQDFIRDGIADYFDETVHDAVLERQAREREELQEKVDGVLGED